MPADQDLTMFTPLYSPDATRVGKTYIWTPNSTAFNTMTSLMGNAKKDLAAKLTSPDLKTDFTESGGRCELLQPDPHTVFAESDAIHYLLELDMAGDLASCDARRKARAGYKGYSKVGAFIGFVVAEQRVPHKIATLGEYDYDRDGAFTGHRRTSLGELTQATYDRLPKGLQGDRLVNALSNMAAKQGDQGIKKLTGSPTIGSTKYNYELKFLGEFGNHRCYGNPVTGGRVEFTVYDPSGSLH